MSKNDSFMFYPDITDIDFNEKIYLKKEFRDTEIKGKKNWNKGHIVKKEFTLDPHQIFLKNYISPDTPYNGILIFHGTGVGKTCSAISIAEGFKKTLKNINKKILILSSLRDNFLKELYDHNKEYLKSNPEDIVQCTGKAYELGDESIYLSKQQKENEILKLKKSYYQFFPYGKFANYVIKETGGWEGHEKNMTDKIRRFISSEFDNRVIIIDEIQNIKTDIRKGTPRAIQPILESIIKYGRNIKLILMSATPMFDRPDEIIYYINLLLLNDGREKIQKNEIFNYKDGSLLPDADKKLRNIFKGYISYIRAEKPFIFPFRINPKQSVIPNIEYYMSGQKIDIDKKIKFTRLILCNMKGTQLKTYLFALNKKIKEGKLKINTDNKNLSYDENDIDNKENKKSMSVLQDLTIISNITYPVLNTNTNKLDEIGSFDRLSIDIDSDNGGGGYCRSIKELSSTKKMIQYKYQSHAIFNKDTVDEAPFADEKYLENYSIKFSNILKTIKESKGLIFIYSQYIYQGTLALALILEQNGFMRECIQGEENQLLDYPRNTLKKGGKRDPICYLCGKEQKHENHNENSKNYHIYKFAKYILYFGSDSMDIVKIQKEEALKKFSSEKNKYGEEIKVFIGTRTVSEGLDFKRIRQVHIIEPWYNLSRHEQIIGRAIRNLSHKDLLLEEQNVEIYQYASVIDDKKNKLHNRESVDLKNYRIAENKDIIIKNIGRIMKESAVDCVFFSESNNIDTNKKVKQITSSGEILDLDITDKPYSTICDYKENCKYKCNWLPNPNIKYPINTDTYNIRFAYTDIEKIKKQIKNMFKENIVFSLDVIEQKILDNNLNIDKIFIYAALEELVENKNEIIYDKFSRKGYIIYRGDYYIFQPFDLDRDEIPLIYRLYPSSIKNESVNLEKIELNYSENTDNEINNSIDVNKLIDNLFKNFSNIYNSHIKIVNMEKKDKLNKYIFAIIGLLLDKLNKEELIIIITYLLKKYLIKDIDNNITNFINYLEMKDQLINYYSEILFDKTKIKNKLFVGFIINNEYYILDHINKNKNIKDLNYKNINFVNCSKELLIKIKSYKNIIKKNIKKKEYNIIYGIIEFDKKKSNKKFKIVDRSLENNFINKNKQKSKRSIITGRTCSTFQINKLMNMRKIVGLYELTTKKGIDFICKDLEIYFRYKYLLNDDNKIWFEEVI